MRIQFSNVMPNFAVNNNKQSNPLKNYQVMSQQPQNDVFVKSKNVSFKGTNEAKDPMEALKTIGFVGGGFALIVGMTALAAKHAPTDPNYVFDSLGNVIYDLNEQSVQSSDGKFIADADDGIFKLKGTGVNIDASKYDIADVEHGVYKNYDGSVDIDLMHNKYIDTENGIFIDPLNKITAIEVDGELKNIQLPSFGSGYPTCPWDSRWNDSYLIGSAEQYKHEEIPLTRSEYKSLFGYEPESDPHGIQAKGEILPDINILEKMKDFLSGDSKEKYDIFGRKFFDFTDTNGNIQKIALDDETAEIIDKFHIKGDSVPELAKFVESLKLEQYVTHNYPDLKDLVQPEFHSVEDFLKSFQPSSDIITYGTDTAPGPDTLIDTDSPVEIDTDGHGDLFHEIMRNLKDLF